MVSQWLTIYYFNHLWEKVIHQNFSYSKNSIFFYLQKILLEKISLHLSIIHAKNHCRPPCKFWVERKCFLQVLNCTIFFTASSIHMRLLIRSFQLIHSADAYILANTNVSFQFHTGAQLKTLLSHLKQTTFSNAVE